MLNVYTGVTVRLNSHYNERLSIFIDKILFINGPIREACNVCKLYHFDRLSTALVLMNNVAIIYGVQLTRK